MISQDSNFQTNYETSYNSNEISFGIVEQVVYTLAAGVLLIVFQGVVENFPLDH